MTVDTITFSLTFIAAAVSSYLALRDTDSLRGRGPDSSVSARRGQDPDNVITGGFAFIMWLVWAFLAQNVLVNPQTGDVEVYTEFTLIGIAMAVVMFLGLLEEVFDWSTTDFFTRSRGDR